MSRSFRKTPICGITVAPSNKTDKIAAHKRWRRAVQQQLHAQQDGDGLPHEKRFLNPWLMAKDGKFWFGGRDLEHLRRK